MRDIDSGTSLRAALIRELDELGNLRSNAARTGNEGMRGVLQKTLEAGDRVLIALPVDAQFDAPKFSKLQKESLRASGPRVQLTRQS